MMVDRRDILQGKILVQLKRVLLKEDNQLVRKLRNLLLRKNLLPLNLKGDLLLGERRNHHLESQRSRKLLKKILRSRRRRRKNKRKKKRFLHHQRDNLIKKKALKRSQIRNNKS